MEGRFGGTEKLGKILNLYLLTAYFIFTLLYLFLFIYSIQLFIFIYWIMIQRRQCRCHLYNIINPFFGYGIMVLFPTSQIRVSLVSIKQIYKLFYLYQPRYTFQTPKCYHEAKAHFLSAHDEFTLQNNQRWLSSGTVWVMPGRNRCRISEDRGFTT